MIGFSLENFKISSKKLTPYSRKFLIDLLKIAPLLPPFAELLQDVQTQGPIKIVFHKINTQQSSAYWDSERRRIYIDHTVSPFELFDALLFELCNANNVFMNQNCALLDPVNYNSAHDYAYANEHCEYFYSQQPYQSIVKQLMDLKPFHKLFGKYDIQQKDLFQRLSTNAFVNFKDYLNTQLKPSNPGMLSHFEQYSIDFCKHYQRRSKKKRNYLTVFDLHLPRALSPAKRNLPLQLKTLPNTNR